MVYKIPHRHKRNGGGQSVEKVHLKIEFVILHKFYLGPQVSWIA